MLENFRQQIWHWIDVLVLDSSVWSRKEKLKSYVCALGVMLFFAYFFYRNFLIAILLLPVGFLFLMDKAKNDQRKRKAKLRLAFQDMLQALASGLRAGYAVENAFKNAYQEMHMLYGEEADICSEMRLVLAGMKNQIPIAKLMQDFAERTKLEEIQEFADVFAIVRKSGGNLPEIIDETAGVIGDKIAVEQEIEVMIAAKKMELLIMNVVPFFIVFYIEFTSPGFFHTLYEGIVGRGIMTLAMIIYLAAYYLGSKMVRVAV